MPPSPRNEKKDESAKFDDEEHVAFLCTVVRGPKADASTENPAKINVGSPSLIT
jgi:hypothetical protein